LGNPSLAIASKSNKIVSQLRLLLRNFIPTTNRVVCCLVRSKATAVFEEKLKTDKGKSLVSAYESTRDAQAIYKELTKHAKSSTAAQLSGDNLLKYITSARCPGNWRGTSYSFVLHWKEQVMH
jgi:hypothetical protein